MAVISDLPVELVELIVAQLSTTDVLSLHQTCRFLHNACWSAVTEGVRVHCEQYRRRGQQASRGNLMALLLAITAHPSPKYDERSAFTELSVRGCRWCTGVRHIYLPDLNKLELSRVYFSAIEDLTALVTPHLRTLKVVIIVNIRFDDPSSLVTRWQALVREMRDHGQQLEYVAISTPWKEIVRRRCLIAEYLLQKWRGLEPEPHQCSVSSNGIAAMDKDAVRVGLTRYLDLLPNIGYGLVRLLEKISRSRWLET